MRHSCPLHCLCEWKRKSLLTNGPSTGNKFASLFLSWAQRHRPLPPQTLVRNLHHQFLWSVKPRLSDCLIPNQESDRTGISVKSTEMFTKIRGHLKTELGENRSSAKKVLPPWCAQGLARSGVVEADFRT